MPTGRTRENKIRSRNCISKKTLSCTGCPQFVLPTLGLAISGPDQSRNWPTHPKGHAAGGVGPIVGAGDFAPGPDPRQRFDRRGAGNVPRASASGGAKPRKLDALGLARDLVRSHRDRIDRLRCGWFVERCFRFSAQSLRRTSPLCEIHCGAPRHGSEVRTNGDRHGYQRRAGNSRSAQTANRRPTESFSPYRTAPASRDLWALSRKLTSRTRCGSGWDGCHGCGVTGA
jgi:hypothetical protein